MQAFSRDMNSCANQAFGSQGRSEEYGHHGYPRSPLHQGARGEDSETTSRRLEPEEDSRYQTEREMAERSLAER